MIEETGEVMIQPSAREPWIPIEEFMNEGEKRDDKQIYFIRTIKLLSNLCLVLIKLPLDCSLYFVDRRCLQ